MKAKREKSNVNNTPPAAQYPKKVSDPFNFFVKVHLIFCVLSLLFVPAYAETNEMEAAISLSSLVNPNGDALAILAGLSIKGHNRPAAFETRPVLLKLTDDFSLAGYRQLNDEVLREISWRPGHDNCLYYITYEKIYGPDLAFGPFYDPGSGKWFKRGTGKLMKLDAGSDLNSPAQVNQSSHLNMSYLRWNQDGSKLAGLAPEPSSRLLNSGKLSVSYDGGKTLELTEIDIFGTPVWLDNKNLLVMTDFDHTISKVSCDESDCKIVETLVVEDSQIVFCGVFNGKPVYLAYPRKDNEGRYIDKSRRLFVGNELVYEADSLSCTFPFTPYLLIEADGKVLIYNQKLALCHEKKLVPKTHVLNFHPGKGTVFLVKDWKIISSYNFLKEQEKKFLFSVDMCPVLLKNPSDIKIN